MSTATAKGPSPVPVAERWKRTLIRFKTDVLGKRQPGQGRDAHERGAADAASR